MKKILGILIMLTLLVFACKKQDVDYPKVTEMYFEQGTPTKIDEGEDINLSPYLVIQPMSVADTVTVSWSTSDEDIAIVSTGGTVEALRAGIVTITATAMDKKATLNLTVEEVEVDEFTIPAKFEVYVGDKVKFPITDVKPKGAPLYRFKWKVDNNGKKPTYSEGSWYLKADEEREYTLTASVDEAADKTCEVKFVKRIITSASFAQSTYNVEVGALLQLKKDFSVEPAAALDTVKITWKSSNLTVAKVDPAGTVTALSAGQAMISATAGGKTATCTINVKASENPSDPSDPSDDPSDEPSDDPSDDPSDPMDPSDPFEPSVIQYTLYYNANGGVGSMSAVTVNENELATVSQNTFSRSGYEFISWNTKADGSGTTYKSGDKITMTSNITLYAIWQDNANGHEYVDLGLSVKWALCNVGASSSIERGDYYAWGETATKSDYSYSTYEQTWKATDIYSSEDVAIKVMGGKWRMPTKTEMEELRDNCTWTWTVAVNGEEGYLVTSKKNGYSIFLPAVGRKIDTNTTEYGERGYYYSSTSPQDVYNRGCGYALIFDNTSQTVAYVSGSQGFSVRAVLP